MKKAKFKSVDSMTLDALITDRKIYIKAKVENIYEKTLIIYVYGVLKEKRDEGYKCIFKQFITEFDFTAINYLDSEEGTWSESTLLRYIESNSWWIEVDNREYRDIKCASDSDNEIINNFYETNNKVGINLINDHQRELRKQALYYKYDIERRELERIHSQAIYLPSDLYDWISEAIVKDNAKFFYETEKKSKIKSGVCSYCKVKSAVDKAYHNSLGECPNCNTKVHFKHVNKAKYYDDTDCFAFAQGIDVGMMVRRFIVKMIYKSPNKISNIEDVEISIREASRSVLNESANFGIHYEYGEFKKSEYRWKKEEYYMGYYGSSTAQTTRNTFMRIYPNNLKTIINGTKWERCAIEAFRGKTDPMDWLEFKEMKLLEMVTRRGLHNLAADMVNKRYETQSANLKIQPSKTMGLSEYSLYMLKKHNLGLRELKIMKMLEMDHQIKVTYEQLLWLIKNDEGTQYIKEILKYSNLQKAINYTEKQHLNENGKEEQVSERYSILRVWKDYIVMAVKEKIDLRNSVYLYPKNVIKAHDNLVLVAKERNDKRTKQGLKNTHKKFEWLKFEYKSLFIEALRTPEEFNLESKVLGHCVARSSYMDQMAKGETIILKLRKKDDPEKPYFTVQVSPKTFKVLHKETSNRKSESKDTTEFIKAWVKHIEKHINKSKPKNNIRRIDHEHRIAN